MPDRGERAERAFKRRQYKRQHKQREVPVAPATRQALWSPPPAPKTEARRPTPDVERTDPGKTPASSRRLERRRQRVLGRVESGKASPREVQMLLRREGYGLKADGVWGPRTQQAWVDYQNRRIQQDQTAIQKRQRDYIQKVFGGGPANPKLEVELFGMEGADELRDARARLERLRTDERYRRQAFQTNPEVYDTDEDGFLAQAKQGLGRAANTYRATGEVIGDLAGDFARNPNEFLLGENAVKAFEGEDFDPTWAAVEGAMLPTGWGKGARRVAGAVRRSQEVERAAPQGVFEARGDTLKDVLDDMGVPETFYPRIVQADERGLPVAYNKLPYTLAIDPKSGEQIPYAYRAISEEDWQGVLQRGSMKSDQRMNLGPEGTVAALEDPSFYLPGKLASDNPGVYQGRIVKIRLDAEDGWKLDRDGYVKTQQEIPLERIEVVSPRLVGTREERLTKSGKTSFPVMPDFQPVREAPAANLVRESLGPARARRAAQEGLYREERAKRVAAAKEAEELAGGGIEGHQAAKAELKGELPKVKFTKLSEGRLSQEELDDLFRQIDDHPDLEFYGRLNARQALLNAFEHNATPRKFEIELLQTVFGQDAADDLVKQTMAQRFGKNVMETLNVPRSLMASFDLSAPFRQALVAGAGHPGIFFKNFAPMIKAARSEKAYKGIMDEIHTRPNAPLYEQSGLKLTQLDELDVREEQFMSNFAEKIPGIGRVVRGSGRGYTGFLNKMRADVFDNLLDVARAEGNNVEDRKFLRSLARYINSSTGRGSLGPVENWAPALNTIFFSPRLMASRINFLDPTWYMRLDPFARKQALKSITRLAGAASVVLGLGALAGAKVGHDPRNADFGKLRIGDTRVDILGGFQQYIRLASQVISGEIVSSSTGRTMKLEAGVGNLSRKDILERFFTGKFAPPPSFTYDFFKGTDYEGEPFDVKVAILERMIPLMAQDVHDLYQDTGNIPLALGAYGVGGLGIGVQTYAAPDVAQKAVDKLTKEAEELGVEPPSEKIQEAARFRALLDDDYESLSKPERAKRLAQLLDERNGSDMAERIERLVGDDDAKAEWFTRKFRSWLYPEVLLYEEKLRAEEDRLIESE